MTSGSADAPLKTELRASALLVLATKVPLLVVLWFFELTTRPAPGPFALPYPLPFGGLARWQSREVLLAAFTSPDAIDPFTSRPFTAMLPVAKGFYVGVAMVADALHVQRTNLAVVATLLLAIPSIALLRGALGDATDRQKTAVSLMLLLGPGSWLVSSPGTMPLLLFAFGAAFYGLDRRKPIWVLVGAALAPLVDPAGILVVPACFAGPREKRPLNILTGIAGAAGLGALVAYYILEKHYALSIALEPLHTFMSWPGGQLGQIAAIFGYADPGPRQAEMVHAFASFVFVAGGVGILYGRLPSHWRVLAIGALLFWLRDFTSAPAIALWCFPAALGWARLLDRVPATHWLAPIVALGAFPIYLRASGHVWDWIRIDYARPIAAGEHAAAVLRVEGLGLAAGPAVPLAGRNGTWQRFDFGAVYCTPSYGCHAIEGVAALRYEEAGGIATCGVPIGERTKYGETYTYRLEHGVIRHQPLVFSEAICGGRTVRSTK